MLEILQPSKNSLTQTINTILITDTKYLLLKHLIFITPFIDMAGYSFKKGPNSEHNAKTYETI